MSEVSISTETIGLLRRLSTGISADHRKKWESSGTCPGPASDPYTARGEWLLTGAHFRESNDSKWPCGAFPGRQRPQWT
jgi:hypothetical protein